MNEVNKMDEFINEWGMEDDRQEATRHLKLLIANEMKKLLGNDKEYHPGFAHGYNIRAEEIEQRISDYMN